MTTSIVNYRIYSDNPYHQLIYSGIGDRYVAAKGDIDTAIDQIKREGKCIFHLHWEEHPLRSCPTVVEAKAAKDYFIKRASYFVRLGGKIVWTIHNAMPHELQHTEIFLALRREIAALATTILVHNMEAVNVLSDQVTLDARKVYYLPHPSYLGIYEPANTVDPSAPPAEPRTLLTFGKVRRYKGFDRLLDLLPPKFMAKHHLSLKISGQPIPDDPFADELVEKAGKRKDVSFDFRAIPDDEVPGLLRSAAGVILPYERFLTSGVALLNIAVGALTVAPDSPQMRELFPAASQFLLFKQDSVEDFQRAVLELINLSPEARAQLVQAYLDRARYLRPPRISRQLGAIYDQLIA